MKSQVHGHCCRCKRGVGRHAQAANLLVAEDGRVQLADFGACALLERVEASAVMSESRSAASLDGGASCDGGSSPLPPQVPRAVVLLAA